MPTISDYLFQSSGGVLTPLTSVWVQAVSNQSGTAYVSNAITTAAGIFTIGPVPSGTYSLNTGPTNVGPWTATGDTNYEVGDFYGWFNVKDFGAKGDGVTDDINAINAAIAACTAAGNGIVWFPTSNYRVSAQVLNPANVELRGSGRNSSFITALGTFPINTPVVRLLATNVIGVACRIRGMAVDCNNISGSTGIYSEGIQENSGIYECMVRNYGAFGVHITQGSSSQPQNFTIEDLEVFSGSGTGASAIGLAINATSLSIVGARVSHVTVFATGSTQLTKAVQFDNLNGCTIRKVHVENAVSGVLIGSVSGCFALHVDAVTANPNVTSAVVISNGSSSQNILLTAILPNGATNSIVDQLTGFTLTAEQAVYAVGNGASSTRTVLSSDAALGSRFKVLRRSVQTPTSSASITVDASAGEKVEPSVLAANATINAPTNPSLGQELTFTFIQDGTGGRTVAWNAVFKQSWSDTGNTLNKRSTITFWYDGTNWNQQGAQTPYV